MARGLRLAQTDPLVPVRRSELLPSRAAKRIHGVQPRCVQRRPQRGEHAGDHGKRPREHEVLRPQLHRQSIDKVEMKPRLRERR
jgi:hypothetical protein